MTFNELDARMRVFETAHDHCVLPGLHMVARLDGRSFTHLTKTTHEFKAPFDPRFRDLMVRTVRHLMEYTGIAFVYGHTHSDELSLLFLYNECSFNRKLRKLGSVLAGEASAAFSLALGALAVLDCRISQLPSAQHVVDYFRWRQADAHRNALNAHCYWVLRQAGQSKSQATAHLEGRSVAEKNELLFSHDINFDALPAWHKRGVALWWERYDKIGTDPRTGIETMTTRRRLREESGLPLGSEYEALVRARVAEAEAQPEPRSG